MNELSFVNYSGSKVVLTKEQLAEKGRLYEQLETSLNGRLNGIVAILCEKDADGNGIVSLYREKTRSVAIQRNDLTKEQQDLVDQILSLNSGQKPAVASAPVAAPADAAARPRPTQNEVDALRQALADLTAERDRLRTSLFTVEVPKNHDLQKMVLKQDQAVAWLLEQVKAKDEELTRLQGELAAAQAPTQALQKQVADQQAELARLQDQLAATQAPKPPVPQANEAENQALQKRVAGQQAELARLQDQLAAAQAPKPPVPQANEAESQALQKQVAEQQAELARLRDELTAAQAPKPPVPQANEAESQALQKQVAEQQAELARLRDELTAAQAPKPPVPQPAGPTQHEQENQRLRGRLATLRGHWELLRKALAEAPVPQPAPVVVLHANPNSQQDARLKALQSRLAELENELGATRQDYASYQTQVRTSEATSQQMAQTLRAELAQQRKLLTEANNNKIFSETALADQRNQIEQLRAEALRLREAAEQERRSADASALETGRAQARLAKATAQASPNKQANSQLEAENARLQAEAKVLAEKLAEAEAQLREQGESLEQLQAIIAQNMPREQVAQIASASAEAAPAEGQASSSSASSNSASAAVTGSAAALEIATAASAGVAEFSRAESTST